MGRLSRPHGLAGALLAKISTNRSERLAQGAELFAEDRPLTLSKSRRMAEGLYVMKFEGIDDRTSASELCPANLYAEPLDDPDELWVHELIGSTVFDSHGTERGRVLHVMANPASDLLCLDSGALVPLTFVLESSNRRIVVNVPKGLFD